MPAVVLADNAYGTLAASITSTDSSITFTAGHGARFPVVVSTGTAAAPLYACLVNSGNVIEEIKITVHGTGSDTATVARAQGGTTAKAWAAGDRIEARLSKTSLLAISKVMVSVKDPAFGAVGDGATDDSSAIQAAIDALPSGGGTVIFPAGQYYIGTGLTVGKHKVTLRGEGSGDYTVGGASAIITDVAALNGISVTSFKALRIENLAVIQLAASPTGRGITLTNAPNSALINAVVHGWDIGARFAPGALASFNCYIIGGQIVSNASINIDAQSNTNGLRIWGTDFGGSTQVGLKFVDSASLHVVGGCEGPSVTCIDIDATSALDVACNIWLHHENSVAGNPTGGVIRLGNTAKVTNVAIGGHFLTNGVASTTPVNALNGSVYSLTGLSRRGGYSSDQTLGIWRFQDAGAGEGAINIARDINSAGSSAGITFTQKNDANTWLRFLTLYMSAASVAAGVETSKLIILARYGGAETELGALEFDAGGNAIVRSNGHLRLGGSAGPRIISGTGSPESAVTGSVGDLFLRTNGGAGTTLYVKESGSSTNTGWVAK